MQTNIGWIGAGVMGEPMCGHLLRAGHAVSVYTRTPDKAAALIGGGARWCESPAAVAADSDVVFTMVGTPDEVRQVYFADNGVLNSLRARSIVIDMGTTAPSLSREIAASAQKMGASAIDAPVSGGDVGARNATLSIMLGGDDAAVAAVMPLLEILGKQIVHMGGPGSGQHTKMCNQIAVAGTMIGVCESLVYAERAGLDGKQLLAAIGSGAAACWTLDNLAPRMLLGDDAPGFMVDHFIKDLGIALQECERMQLDLPGLALAHELYRNTRDLGHGHSGTQALIHAIRTVRQA